MCRERVAIICSKSRRREFASVLIDGIGEMKRSSGVTHVSEATNAGSCEGGGRGEGSEGGSDA